MTEPREQRLPSGWALRTLREVGTWQGGGTPSKETPEYWTAGTIPWVSPKDMKTDVLTGAHDHITDEAVANSTTSVVPAGSVLLVVRSGILKHTLPVAVAQRDLAINQDLKAVTPTTWVDSVYLAYALRAFARDILNTCTKAGTTVQNVNFTALLDYRVPIAPLSEQHRIVEEIEKQLTRLEAGVAALKRVQANLKRYRAAVLKAACEGHLVPTEADLARREGRSYEPASILVDAIAAKRAKMDIPSWRRRQLRPAAGTLSPNLPALPESWVWTTVAQLGAVLGGLTKNPKRAKLHHRYPYLRVANVYANELRLNEIEQIGVEDRELEKLLLAPGDLLIVEGNGSKEQIGRVALWDGSIDPCVHQNHLIKVRLYEPKMASWVLIWLLSPGGRDVVERVASSTSGLYTLSVGKVGDLAVPLPPPAEQHRIVAEVERRLSLADNIGRIVFADLHRSTRLRQSALKRALDGGL